MFQNIHSSIAQTDCVVATMPPNLYSSFLPSCSFGSHLALLKTPAVISTGVSTSRDEAEKSIQKQTCPEFVEGSVIEG